MEQTGMLNHEMACEILLNVDQNWFAFVLLLEDAIESQGLSQESFSQFLVEFVGHLSELGLTADQLNLTEQSRAAYLTEIEQKTMRVDQIIEDLESEDESYEADISEIIRSKLKLIVDKGKRLAKSEIESKGLFGGRKSSERTNSILTRHPDIGEVMEDMVKEADVGADKWHRTGVYILQLIFDFS